jgi:hypothetical protein
MFMVIILTRIYVFADVGVSETSRLAMINGIVKLVQTFDSTEATEQINTELYKFQIYCNDPSRATMVRQNRKPVKEINVWLEHELNKLQWKA